MLKSEGRILFKGSIEEVRGGRLKTKSIRERMK